MKLGSLLVRRIHRYLMTFLAIQVFLWVLSGVYMVLIDIQYIRGNHLVIPSNIVVKEDTPMLPLSFVFQHYPQALNISLQPLGNRLVYQFVNQEKVGDKVKNNHYLIDAYTGNTLSAIDKDTAHDLAVLSYSGDAVVDNIIFIDKDAPSELSARHLPVWRVSFNNLTSDTLYISATNGQVVTKRHFWWRVFDIFWMLHIMDYEERSDVSNLLLRCFSITFILAIFSGVALLVTRIKLRELTFWAKR